MKEFKLLRYFRKWWWLIVLCSLIGGGLFLRYALGSQSYVAQTVLTYTNEEAEFGKTPSGADINPGEVLSSFVISQALENAGVKESVDRVRSRLTVTEDIPDDVAAVQKAAWAEGLEYVYYPTEFVISYSSGTDASADDARIILEAIVDSYYQYYGQHYVAAALVPSSLRALLAIEYDPIELVEALDAYVQEILAYVTSNAGYSPDYRSSRSGYSFENLVSEYTLFQESTLPALYARVIGSRASSDRDVLVMKYKKRVADNLLSIENLQTRASDIERMIAAFVEKNQESMDYHWNQEDPSAIGVARGTNYVLGQVYEFENGNFESERTTYDTLLLQYVSNHDQIEALKLDNVYCSYILDAYDTDALEDSGALTAARDALSAACERLLTLESALTLGASEYMEYRAAQNLSITSTVNVYSTMNIKLYLVLAVALFFLVGCVGAVVLGRGQDFMEYALYVDHISGLANRRRCDAVLESYSRKPCEPPFSCVYLRIDNIAALNIAHGYTGGTQAIAAMGKLLSLCAEDFGFVGYNDSAQFMGVFPACSGARAAYFLSTLRSAVDGFNAEDPTAAIEYRAASASLEEGEVGTARDLLRQCIDRLKQLS